MEGEAKKSLSKQAGRGALWQLGMGGVSTTLRLGASAVLARHLEPDDFGILGLCIIALNAIAYLGNFGIAPGIIAKQDLTEEDLNTGFWVLTANRIAIFTLAFFSAPLFAMFFNEPRVTSGFRVVCVVFLLSALEGIPRALLTKHLRFGILSSVRLASTVIESGVAITFALTTDLRYWSLIIGMLSGYIFSLCVFIFYAGWTPGWGWSKTSFHYYKKFIIHGFNSSIVVYLKDNIDYILVGRVLGAQSLGYYEYAYKIPHTFTDSLIGPMSSVLQPIFSKLQKQKEAAGNGYLRAIQLIVMIAFPCLTGLAAIADVAVPVLWGDKWQTIIVPLQILCFSAMLQVLCLPNGQIFLANQRPELVFSANLTGLIVTLLSVGSLGYFFNINGVAIGMALGNIPNIYYISKMCEILEITFMSIIINIFGIIIAATGCATISWTFMTALLAYKINLPLVFILSMLSGAISYCMILYFIDKKPVINFFKIIEETVNIKIKLPFIN